MFFSKKKILMLNFEKKNYSGYQNEQKKYSDS